MADAKVLDAQKWVNATYGNVAGYSRCPEDGRTGWATMYSLTMGLQHELGISPVVANFGPGTLSRLTAYGDIGPGTSNKNIVKIVQHALFCKGYWGGDGDGIYGNPTIASVKTMKENMGYGVNDASNGSVQPKFFKALLTMDAYVLLAGGSEEVRSIQQWLNQRYLHKSTFFIGPCDGHYSRDVQTALMKGIQYEIGIPESQVNGNFGPGTQAGLRNNQVAEGDAGVFVQLFSAACVFNSPVLVGGTPYTTRFRMNYDSALREFVKAFQRFSMLDVNGMGDYPTWAQLLVSTGDPNRPATACDTRFTITASRARSLRDAGYTHVGRYLYDPPGSTLDKEIKPGELRDMFDNGLRVFPIYQDNARRLSDFTYIQGFEHAVNAHDLAADYGFNRGTVIYFAVDYDATTEEIESNIVSYFEGVAAGLSHKGKRYVHGVYGSRNVCARVTKATHARWSFVSGMSWGFSGNLGFPLPQNWSFNQIKEFQFVSGSSDAFDLDNDVRRAGADNGQGSVHDSSSPADAFISYIEDLYAIAQDYGGSDPNRLVMEFLRHEAYNNVQWWSLIGGPDDDFIAYAKDRGARIMREFQDPFTGHALGVEHLMATANAHYVKPQGSNVLAVGVGDVGGWGGDIITLYGEWRRDVDSYPSGYTYVMDKFARIGVNSTFAFNDLVEDADGYLLARKVRSMDIASAVRSHYNGSGGLSRFQEFYEGRFGGSLGEATDIARNMLTTDSDNVIVAGRTMLITKYAGYATLMPSMLPAEDLTRFCRAFAESLRDRTLQESSLRSTYLKNQRRFMGGS